MEKETFLVIPALKGKVQYHKFELSGAFVSSEWGLIGGKPQTTSDPHGFTNEGKANQLTPEETAEASFNRKIRNKIKEGYIMVASLEDLPDLAQVQEIDLGNIPVALCCSKPKQKISIGAMDKLIKSGNAQFFIKYNGLCHYILIDPEGNIKVFTRRWLDHTSKYPDLVADIKSLDLPWGTLLITEFVIDPLLQIPHMVAYSKMASIHKTNTKDGICDADQTASLELQKAHRVKAVVYAILYSAGEKVWDQPYQVQLNTLNLAFPSVGEDRSFFVPKEVPIATGAQALDIALKHKKKIEGFIVWDVTQAMTMTLNGKPDRVAAWKVKSKSEMDVIAFGGVEGSGKNQCKYSSLKIGQYNTQGEQVDLGTVSGLKEYDMEPGNWDFPCVIEIEYDQRFPDTGKFQFGHFTKQHAEKLPEEVGLFSTATL